MFRIAIRTCLALAIIAAAMGMRDANAQNVPNQDFLDQDWVLDPAVSNVYLQTVKANAKFETHQFTAVEGNVGRDGAASVRIDLKSIETGVDLRNVRLRFLLFQIYKFPTAEITAKLDKTKLAALATETRIKYPLTLTVNMHGIVKDIETAVWITRMSETTVSVATIQPIIVNADTFDFTAGIAKLSEAVGGTLIAPAASLTFDLVFGTGSLTAGLETARATRAEQSAAAARSVITADDCETRMSVISQTGAIYFKTGSAELDRESEPLLNSGADIASRCQSIKIDVEGHTDNVGQKASNRQLSAQRAKSVVDYLVKKGVNPALIQSAGYGDTRPVVANDSEANRAKNRRIEFKVEKAK
jgi:OOP family OmpA-OmpF porin